MPGSGRLRLGELEARPGELVCGFAELLPLPSGRAEAWPLMLLQGREPGPTLWLTANIHGNELTGIAALHRVVRPELAERLRGTIVAVPSLNPAGLRSMARAPYYWAEGTEDPNRQFPALPRPGGAPAAHDSAYEQAAAVLFDWVRQSADLLLDLHCASIHSVPHVIRDRVLYAEPADCAAAEQLARRLEVVARGLGLPVVNEFPPQHYVAEHLHRSLSGACTNVARIPALTLELGAPFVVDPSALEAAVLALQNALVLAEMVEGTLHPIPFVPGPAVDYPLRREDHPRAPTAGLISYRVAAGATVGPDQVVAELRDVFGRPVGGGEVRAGQEGWIIGLRHGLAVYPRQPLATMGVRDEAPLVAPYPE
ncbi:MAG: succinylglutamate desuccinylase/aspartoacylase family protein [Chloroflexi bacterium]|nr:succinylglutamate desuccinylase/aspartoacylase family protein [Chloroflexota bacterium]